MPRTLGRGPEHGIAGMQPSRGNGEPLARMLGTRVRTAGAGQTLLMEGDRAGQVLCLLDGWLSLSKCLADGDAQIVDLALPGEIIETAARDGAVSALTIEALTDASVATVPIAIWQDMLLQRPDLLRVSHELRIAARARTAARMLRLGRGKAVMRLAYAILELQLRLTAIGKADAGGFRLPMNQRQIGDFIGLSSVHVCRTLGQLTDKGILRTGGQMRIDILRPEALAELAGVDPDVLCREILAPTDQEARPPALPACA